MKSDKDRRADEKLQPGKQNPVQTTVPMTQPFGTRPAKEEQSLTCFHVGSCLQWHIDQERLPILHE
jgi:hypothetical protein